MSTHVKVVMPDLVNQDELLADILADPDIPATLSCSLRQCKGLVAVTLTFEDALTEEEDTALAALCAAHVGTTDTLADIEAEVRAHYGM